MKNNKILLITLICMFTGTILGMTSRTKQPKKTMKEMLAPIPQSAIPVAPPAQSEGSTDITNDLNTYGQIFQSDDLFGSNLNFVNWNAAVQAIQKKGPSPATKQILRYNDQLIKTIQDARTKVGTNQNDTAILKWENDLDSINLLIFSGVTATGAVKIAGQIIKDAAARANAQIKQYRDQHWKSIASTRTRTRGSATPPKPIAQAMQNKPLPQPPTKTGSKGTIVRSGKGMTVRSK